MNDTKITYPPIVILDDDHDECQMLEKGFHQIGRSQNILFFHSGIELIEYLNVIEPYQHPCLIILDYHLANVKGDEITREIRRNPFLQHIHIIIYSVIINKQIKDQLIHENVLLFIEKGSNYEKLVQQVSFFSELI